MTTSYLYQYMVFPSYFQSMSSVTDLRYEGDPGQHEGVAVVPVGLGRVTVRHVDRRVVEQRRGHLYHDQHTSSWGTWQVD